MNLSRAGGCVSVRLRLRFGACVSIALRSVSVYVLSVYVSIAFYFLRFNSVLAEVSHFRDPGPGRVLGCVLVAF